MKTPTLRPPRAAAAPGAAAAGLAALSLLAGCATPPREATDPFRQETVYAVTADAALVRFRASSPRHLLQRTPLAGLPAGERLLGIDFRVSRGVLFALSSGGRLYTVDTATGALSPVGSAPPLALDGERFGVDFNPVADRLRVVSDSGQNLRLHPDTGTIASTDPALQYADGDSAAGRAPKLAGAAYTYNKRDDKLTTNYAIDLAAGTLVTQGTVEGKAPAVSPNTGRLYTVGPLGVEAVEDAAFDIADRDNGALAALRIGGRTVLHKIDLASGRATPIGTIGDGGALWGIAIEP